jgi:Ni/Co efflux regulator RcnB/surface antigen
MKRIIAATLAFTLLTSTAAWSQPFGPDRGGQGDRSGQGSNQPGGYQGDNRGRGDQDQRVDTRRVSTPRWSPGDRLSDQYRQKQYVASDWRQHGLRTPPKGYQWVRNEDNDFFLVAIRSGVIRQVNARDDRDQKWRQRYQRTYTYNDDTYYQQCRSSSDPAGVIAGGLIGGLLGRALGGDGGSRAGATIAGVIFGGAVGAALTNKLDCEDRSYAYKSYYDGFNAGRPNTTYQWRNPKSQDRGQFRVGSYYNDQAGFRCANYTQTIYINGRPQNGTGRACRQADGSWVIVN